MQKYADILLLSRENTHRILTGFEKKSILRMNKTEIIITDKQQLIELSKNVSAMMGFLRLHLTDTV